MQGVEYPAGIVSLSYYDKPLKKYVTVYLGKDDYFTSLDHTVRPNPYPTSAASEWRKINGFSRWKARAQQRIAKGDTENYSRFAEQKPLSKEVLNQALPVAKEALRKDLYAIPAVPDTVNNFFLNASQTLLNTFVNATKKER
jgi:hypothetical protein